MRHGLEICCGGPSVTASLLVELGELAERAGWDGVFFEDYLVYYEGDDPARPFADGAARNGAAFR